VYNHLILWPFPLLHTTYSLEIESNHFHNYFLLLMRNFHCYQFHSAYGVHAAIFFLAGSGDIHEELELFRSLKYAPTGYVFNEKLTQYDHSSYILTMYSPSRERVKRLSLNLTASKSDPNTNEPSTNEDRKDISEALKTILAKQSRRRSMGNPSRSTAKIKKLLSEDYVSFCKLLKFLFRFK
jgi:hypothetical protein